MATDAAAVECRTAALRILAGIPCRVQPSARGPPSQGPGGRHGTLRSARRGRIPLSTPAPDRSRKRDMTRARRPAIAWRPALAAAAPRPSPAAPRRRAGFPPPGPLARPKPLRQVGAPADLTGAVIPPDNRQTPQKIALGEKLFFDGRLSADGTVACATCHDPARAFTDGKPVSIGIEGRAGQRNAPTILNALYNKTQFWDGRVTTLEQQAQLPTI